MNILIVSEKAGIAGSTYSTAYLSIGLSKQGHQVFLACPDQSTLSQLVQNTGVRHIPMKIVSKIDRKNIRAMARIVREHQIDIINAQSSRDRYITILAKWLYKLPVKLVHTRRQLAKSIGILGQSWFYEKGTDKIVAVSQGVKESLVKIGIRASHIKVIYNGTPPEKYASLDLEKTEKLRKKYNIQKDDIVLGSVSRLKKQHQILEALMPLRQKVKVLFVGIDPQPAYQTIIRKFPIEHEVYFTGSVSGTEALHYYGLFTMKILASTIEGLSQSLLEAMALGVPVIATRVGGNPELIQNGQNGLLFDNNDIATLTKHIQQLIEKPEMRKMLAAHGRKTALEDFSIEKTVATYEQFFKNLLLT